MLVIFMFTLSKELLIIPNNVQYFLGKQYKVEFFILQQIYILNYARRVLMISIVTIVNRSLFIASVVLLPLLGLTWIFGILTINSNTTVFAWLFTIFNSVQVLIEK